MPEIRARRPIGLRPRDLSSATGKVALQIHRAARLLDAAAWLERDRAGENDLARRWQIERDERRPVTRRLKQPRPHRTLLLANPPDLVFFVVGRRRETANLEHRRALGVAERDGAGGGCSRRKTGQTDHSCVRTEARKRQVGGLRDLGLKRSELVASIIQLALHLDDFRRQRCYLI